MEEGTKERRGRRNNNNKINGSHKTTFDRAISTISISVLLFTRLFFCVSALLHFVDEAKGQDMSQVTHPPSIAHASTDTATGKSYFPFSHFATSISLA